MKGGCSQASWRYPSRGRTIESSPTLVLFRGEERPQLSAAIFSHAAPPLFSRSYGEQVVTRDLRFAGYMGGGPAPFPVVISVHSDTAGFDFLAQVTKQRACWRPDVGQRAVEMPAIFLNSQLGRMFRLFFSGFQV